VNPSNGRAQLAITRRLPFKSKGEIMKIAAFVMNQSLQAWSPAG
jgi:hypothetical protein